MHDQSQEIPLNVTLMLSMDFCMDDGISPQEWKARCAQPLIKDPSLSWLSTLELSPFLLNLKP